MHYLFSGSHSLQDNLSIFEFWELLHTSKDSLEELYLDLPQCLPMEGYLIPIRNFSALKKLDTTIRTWGKILLAPGDHEESLQWLQDKGAKPLEDSTEKICDCLPPSLTTFELRETGWICGPQYWDVRQLEHLISHRHGELPNLRTVTYICCGVVEAGDIYPPFRTLVEHANMNDDGFELVTRSDAYWTMKEPVHRLYNGETRKEMQHTKWKGGRYSVFSPRA